MSGNGEETGTGEQGTGEPGNEGTTTVGAVFRKKLEDTLTENQVLQGKLLVHEAGLGHLNAAQRAAVVHTAQASGTTDLTADILKETSKTLGFPEAPAAPKNEGSNEGENGQGGENANQGGEEEIDPATGEALTAFEAIERTQRAAVANADPNSFEAKLKAAKSTGEVEALVRAEGHKVGIVLESDVE